MVYVKSFLNNPTREVTDLNEMLQSPEMYFIDIDDSKSIINIYNRLDLDYLNGAILYKYNNEVLMDFRLWDLIDQLWSYIINLIEDFIDNDIAETYFPDQPIKISISKVSNSTVLFSVNSKQWQLERDCFLKSLLDGAENFFIKMTTYSKHRNEYYEDELGRIRSLRKRAL